MAKSLLDRFEAKVMVDPNSGCWLWTGYVDPASGYGQFNGGYGRSKKAHRWAYTLYKSEIPRGLDLDHKCRIRCCVNPDHLEPVTRKENLHRGISTKLANEKFSSRQYCRNGHPVTEKDSRFRVYGKLRYFQCLICGRDWARNKKVSAC